MNYSRSLVLAVVAVKITGGASSTTPHKSTWIGLKCKTCGRESRSNMWKCSCATTGYNCLQHRATVLEALQEHTECVNGKQNNNPTTSQAGQVDRALDRANNAKARLDTRCSGAQAEAKRARSQVVKGTKREATCTPSPQLESKPNRAKIGTTSTREKLPMTILSLKLSVRGLAGLSLGTFFGTGSRT